MRPPGYSALMAKRVADDMVDLDRIVEARKVAVADADRYLDDVTEYCKYLSQRFQFVRRNVDWFMEISIRRIYAVEHGGGAFYIGLGEMPVIHGRVLTQHRRPRGSRTFPIHHEGQAITYAFDMLSLVQPRFIVIARNCISAIRRGIAADDPYVDAMMYREYRFKDVMTLACDEAETASGPLNMLGYRFDVETI
ncbi:MAG: hypothetical protein WCQ69_08690 [Bacteroidales bacterium]